MESKIRRFIVTEVDGFWTIEQLSINSIYPLTEKNTAREVLARLAQILETGPIAPQLHPERVEVKLNE